MIDRPIALDTVSIEVPPTENASGRQHMITVLAVRFIVETRVKGIQALAYSVEERAVEFSLTAEKKKVFHGQSEPFGEPREFRHIADAVQYMAERTQELSAQSDSQ